MGDDAANDLACFAVALSCYCAGVDDADGGFVEIFGEREAIAFEFFGDGLALVLVDFAAESDDADGWILCFHGVILAYFRAEFNDFKFIAQYFLKSCYIS